MWWMSQSPSTGTGVPMAVVIYSCFDRSMFGLLALSRALFGHFDTRPSARLPMNLVHAKWHFKGLYERLNSVPNVLLDASVSVEAPASSTIPGVRMWSVRMPCLHPEDPGGGYRWARHCSCHGQRAADADEKPAASLERAAD